MKVLHYVSLIIIIFFAAHSAVAQSSTPQDLRKAAEAGNAKAQFELGKKYNHGLDKAFGKSFVKAKKWLEKAAKKNHADAMFHLGVMQETGRGFVPDAAAAFNWYLEAAKAGHADAMYTLSLMYEEGRGVKPDPAEAAYWYQQALAAWSSPVR
jgi:TPR repeat protein